MENFLDHMTFVFLTGAIIGIILGGWCWFGEKIINKFWSREEFVEFLFGSKEEE